MAEEPEEEEQSEDGSSAREAAQRGSRLKQFLFLAVLILILQSAVAYVLVTWLVLPKVMAPEEVTETVQEKTAEDWPKVSIEQPLTYDMGDMILNPKDPEMLRFLSARVVLQVDNPGVLDELKDKLIVSKLTDRVRDVLSETPTHKMNLADERKGLRDNLKAKINASGILESGQVTAVYFRHFVVQ